MNKLKQFEIKPFVKSHPVISTVFIIQILFVLVLSIISVVKPREMVSVDFSTANNLESNVYIENNILHFVPLGDAEGNNEQTISFPIATLPSSSYTISVNYDSLIENNKLSDGNCYVELSSKYWIDFNKFLLDDEHNNRISKFWIPRFSKIDDLSLDLQYTGEGPLEIHSINIEENKKYRLYSIAQLLLLLIIVDFIILLFFTSYKIDFSRKNYALILIIFAASIAFLQSRSLFFANDMEFHIQRIVGLARGIQNGQFPVRLSTEFNNGYGYPTSIYYSDIFLYPVAILYMFAVPARVCYEAYGIIANIITALVAYYSFGKISGNENTKLVGTAVYLLSSYRLANLFIRGAVGEYTAMVFTPLVIVSIYLLYTDAQKNKDSWIMLSIGMSGLILSNIVTVEMIIINVIVLVILLPKKTFKKDMILSVCKAAACCIGLTAFFSVPFLDYMLSHTTIVQKGDLRLMEDTAQEAIRAFALFTPKGKQYGYEGLGMVLIVGLLISIICFIMNRYDMNARVTTLRYFVVFAIMNFVFMWKVFPWDGIQSRLGIEGLGYQLGTIQFPWRFLGISAILISFAVVLSLDLLKERNDSYYNISILALISCIVISVGFFYYTIDDSEELEYYGYVDEFGMTDNLYLLNGSHRSELYVSEAKVLAGDAVINSYYKSDGVAHVDIVNEGNDTSTIEVPIFAYKYYDITDNMGSKYNYEISDFNCIMFEVPSQYNGSMSIRFKEPILWRVSEVISVLFFVFFVILVLKIKKRSISEQ